MAINPATRLYIPKFDAPKEAKTQRVESNVSNIVINILPYKIEVFKTIRVDDFIDILCIKTNILFLSYKGFILDNFQVDMTANFITSSPTTLYKSKSSPPNAFNMARLVYNYTTIINRK